MNNKTQKLVNEINEEPDYLKFRYKPVAIIDGKFLRQTVIYEPHFNERSNLCDGLEVWVVDPESGEMKTENISLDKIIPLESSDCHTSMIEWFKVYKQIEEIKPYCDLLVQRVKRRFNLDLEKNWKDNKFETEFKIILSDPAEMPYVIGLIAEYKKMMTEMESYLQDKEELYQKWRKDFLGGEYTLQINKYNAELWGFS